MVAVGDRSGVRLVDPATRASTPILAGRDVESWVVPIGDGRSFFLAQDGRIARATMGDDVAVSLESAPMYGAVIASDTAGDTVVFEKRVPQALAATMSIYRRGQPEPIELHRFAFSGGAAVSSDGRDVVISGVEEPCDNPHRCPISLFRVGADNQLVRIPTRDDRAAYKPQLIDDGGTRWLVYQTTAHDESPECARDTNKCQHDIVRRRFPDGAEETIATHAIAFAQGPNGRRAWLSHDNPDCDTMLCPKRLHVVDESGDHVIDERAFWLLPTAFSPDGRYLAYSAREPDNAAKLVSLEDMTVTAIGAGIPRAWLSR